MKPSTAIELAVAKSIQMYANIGRKTKIRAFHNMNFDGTFDKSVDREYPFIGVSASLPMTTDDQASQYVDVGIFIATLVVDDKDHLEFTAICEAVQGVIDRLYAGFRSGFDLSAISDYGIGETATKQQVYAYFCNQVSTNDSENLIASAEPSFTLETSQPPVETDGANMNNLTLRVHFGRTDF